VPDPATGSSINVPFTAPVGDGGCAAIQGTGSVTTGSLIPRIIACDSLDISANTEIILGGAAGQANRAFTEYVLVHELGHLFDNRTILGTDRLLNLAFQGLASGDCPLFLQSVLPINANLPSPTPLSFDSSCVDVVDSKTRRVLGIRTELGKYGRRDRGWGTGPDNTFTDFQQHPGGVFSILTKNLCPSSEDILSSCYDPSIVIEEEAADMFLNWVYRSISNIPLTYLTSFSATPPGPGTWNGFLNQSWGTYEPNKYNGNDNLYPGDARMEWMQIVMKTIFAQKGW
jgi:hypothetical protein